MDKTSGKVIMWVLTVLAALLALLYFPSRGSFIILLGVVIMIPIKKMEAFWTSKNVKLWIRFVAGLVFLVVGWVAANNAESIKIQERAERQAAQAEATAKASEETKKTLIGEWHYGESVAIDIYFLFNEDGTFHRSSDGGGDDEGTYEVVDGNKVKLHGDWSDRDYEFTLENADTLKDSEGANLSRLIRE